MRADDMVSLNLFLPERSSSAPSRDAALTTLYRDQELDLNQWFPNLFEPLPKSRRRLYLITLNENFSHFMSKISFPVIAHNIEQHCGFGSALPPEEPHITPSLGTTVLNAFKKKRAITKLLGCYNQNIAKRTLKQRRWGDKMLYFRRITLFCLEKRFSKHKITIFSKIFWGNGPFSPLATPMNIYPINTRIELTKRFSNIQISAN